MKIAAIMLSRERAEQCVESIDKMIACCSRPNNLFFYVIIDDDDPQKKLYQKLLGQKQNIVICFSPVGQKYITYNQASEQAYQNGCDVLMWHADDAFFHQSTCQDWDIILQEKIGQFDDKICLCYFDDSIAEKYLATHPIITRQWYEILGYFVPIVFYHEFVDTWVDDIAWQINRLIYIPEVKFDHQHFSNGKSQEDSTYRKNKQWVSFGKFNYNYYRPLRDKHAKTLIKHIYPKKIANRMLRERKIKRFFEKFF